MLLDARAADIVYTPAVSGVAANFLRPSLAAAGVDPDALPAHKLDLGEEARAWKTVWSAGQGVGAITDLPSAARPLRPPRRRVRRRPRRPQG